MWTYPLLVLFLCRTLSHTQEKWVDWMLQEAANPQESMEGPGRREAAELRVQVMGVGWGPVFLLIWPVSKGPGVGRGPWDSGASCDHDSIPTTPRFYLPAYACLLGSETPKSHRSFKGEGFSFSNSSFVIFGFYSQILLELHSSFNHLDSPIHHFLLALTCLWVFILSHLLFAWVIFWVGFSGRECS